MLSRHIKAGLVAASLVAATGSTAGAQTFDLVFRDGFDPSALNETDLPAEADYCTIQFPLSFAVDAGLLTPPIYGRLFEAGVTPAVGPPAGWIAQIGHGAEGSDPRTASGWQLIGAAYNLQVGNDDEFVGSFVAPAAGTYSYVFRFSGDGGGTWTYCDTDGAGSNFGLTFEAINLGTMTVQ
jgi:hypothetical protein